MAIVLYRTGDTHNIRGIRCTAGRFDGMQLDQMISEGWVSDPQELVEPVEDELVETQDEEANAEEVSQEAQAPEVPEESEQTEEEVRAIAKTLGIKGWHNTGIPKLLVKIETARAEA